MEGDIGARVGIIEGTKDIVGHIVGKREGRREG